MKNRMLFLSFLSVTSVVGLSGCSGMHLASMASMAVTGKGFSDHALSTVTGQDCALFNVVEGEQFCYSDDSVEMTLLTNEQNFDESLKVVSHNKQLTHEFETVVATQDVKPIVPAKNVVESEPSAAFLVIGSFTQRSKAESYRSDYQEWNSRVIKVDHTTAQGYRVVIGPVAHQDKARLKRIFINKGVQTPWLMSL